MAPPYLIFYAIFAAFSFRRATAAAFAMPASASDTAIAMITLPIDR